LALEYEDVLKRGLAGLDSDALDGFLDYLFLRSNLVPVFFRWRPVLKDPDDDRVLEVAVRTQATIVTFNKADFAGAAAFGLRVTSPAEFLAIMDGGR
jgi:predicted nucleic acid-binding protein